MHVVSAYAHEAGLILAQRAVEGKSNEITAIQDVLGLLEIDGTIVTIDAIGTQKSIAGQIIAKKADYLLALKGNQKALHDDVIEFFSDPELTATCPQSEDTNFGHGRIEERTCRTFAAEDGLITRHPEWDHLHSIAEVTVQRTHKKTRETYRQTRYYISSLQPDPAIILAASRSHWSVENNVHWQLDVSLHEDNSRTRKDHSARNLAMMRRAVLNMARREPSRMSIKRKRLKAALNKEFRTKLIVC